MYDTKILISPELADVLQHWDIKQYGPAYSGESAGLDLYYTGKDAIYWEKDETPRLLGSEQPVKLIPTGLRVAIPPGYVGLILDRGSISKTPLIRRAGVVDSGYTDEVFVNLTRPSGANYYMIHPGDKLPVQLVVVACLNRFTSITEQEFLAHVAEAKRQSGKVGSSD